MYQRRNTVAFCAICICAMRFLRTGDGVCGGKRRTVKRRRRAVPASHRPFSQITSIVFNQNQEKTNVIQGPDCRTLYGTPELTDTLCGLQIRLSPLSFYQVNREQTQRLYQKAADLCHLTGQETLLDLYCGAGTIGLSMAHKVKRVIGVEIVPEAVENARKMPKQTELGMPNSCAWTPPRPPSI